MQEGEDDRMSTERTILASTAIQHVSWPEFGEYLQHLRRKRGLSQDGLAALMSCHRTHVWRLEHGQTKPSQIFLQSLVGILQHLEGQRAPTTDEIRFLRGFKLLHMYHCESIDLASVPVPSKPDLVS